MAESKNQYRFPKRFLWGASTSAHQVEGGNVNQWSQWEQHHALTLSKQAKYRLSHVPAWEDVQDEATQAENYISGGTVDHYHRYEEDFDILKSLNMNAFRCGIEWSRLEPREGEWDEAELEHYHEYFKAMQKRGIEPIVTLFHWTLPIWFTDKGGFEKRANVDYFVKFAQKVFDEYGAYLRIICTLNEPQLYIYKGWIDEDSWPPSGNGKWLTALRVNLNLVSAHRRVHDAAKRTSRRLKIGIAGNLSYYYPGDNSLRSKVAVWWSRYLVDDWFMNRIRRHIDYIGVNYYFSNRFIHGKIDNENIKLNDLGWEMRPDDIEHVIVRLYKRYQKPIIITENGVADRSDRYRQWWIAHTLHAIHAAMARGVKVDGYLHWSLLDNFEWSFGRWPRFGLVEVDYKTMKRTPRQSALWFGKVIARIRKG